MVCNLEIEEVVNGIQGIVVRCRNANSPASWQLLK